MEFAVEFRLRLTALDQARGLAALWILGYHAYHLLAQALSTQAWPQAEHAFASALIEGHAAVGLFFVLSGTALTIRAAAKPVRWSGFLRNRLLRTLPLFAFVLLIAACIYPERFSFSALAGTLLGFGPSRLYIPPFTSVTWAIAVEWHCYLLFPVLLLAQVRWGNRYLVGLIGLLLLCRIAALATTGQARDLSYFTVLGRLDQFAVGMLLGAALVKGRTLNRPGLGFAAAVVAVLAMLFGFNRAGGWIVDAGWRVLWPLVEAAVFAYLLLAWHSWKRLVAHNTMRGLALCGTVGYSVYLTHFIVIVTLLEHGIVLGSGSGSIMVTAMLNIVLLYLPLTLLLSSLTYWIVERPWFAFRSEYASGIRSDSVLVPPPIAAANADRFTVPPTRQRMPWWRSR